MQIPKKVKKRKTKTPYQRAADAHWRAFSRYIRRRDCLMTTGDPTQGRCVTCGKVYDYRDLQAGHYVPGRRNSIKFDDRNCHAQCVGCNIWGRGQGAKYHEFMLKTYGQDVIDELWYKNSCYRKWLESEHREEADRLNRWAKIIEDDEVVPREAAGPYLDALRRAVGGAAE